MLVPPQRGRGNRELAPPTAAIAAPTSPPTAPAAGSAVVSVGGEDRAQQLALGRVPPRPQHEAHRSVRRRQGSAAAAYVVERVGCASAMPDKQQLDDFILSHEMTKLNK